MVAFGFGVLWLGYLQAIYGFCLLKGYDIRWRDLANPVHPYQWPASGTAIPTVPPGQILPGGSSSSATIAKTGTTPPGKGIPPGGIA